MNEIKEQLVKVQKEIENLKAVPNFDVGLLNKLYDKRSLLHSQFSDIKTIKMNDHEKFNQIVESILASADIICCTLASAGSDKLEKFREYIEAVIVDEASQCTEPSNIIPLQYSPKKLILIGDPKQLPATTFSQDAYKTNFNRSLFERILESGVEPFFLSEQYRMAPQIRKFPSLYFYNDRLKDAQSVVNRKFPPYLSSFQNKNILFFDTKFSREGQNEHSFFNKTEMNVCVEFLRELLKRLKQTTNSKHVIGCISPYQKQVQMINNRLKEVFSVEYRNYITVNTVDAFQGQEKDIIIFSAVRASANPSAKDNIIGFLSDVRRLNVAITRPKFALIVLGNSETLATHHTWRSYIEFMAKNNSYLNVSNEGEIDRAIQMILRNEYIPSQMLTLTLAQRQPVKKYHREFQRQSIEEGEIVNPSVSKSMATASTEPSEKGVVLKKKPSKEEKKKKIKIKRSDTLENAILNQDDDFDYEEINVKRKMPKEDSVKFSDDSTSFDKIEVIEKKIKQINGFASNQSVFDNPKPVEKNSGKKAEPRMPAIDQVLDPNYKPNADSVKKVSAAKELKKSNSKQSPSGLFSKTFLEQREKNKEEEDDPEVIKKLFGNFFQ